MFSSVGALPIWKGGMLRRAFASALAESAELAPGWPGLIQHCTLATALFAPQEAWATAAARSPWSLSCPDGDQRHGPQQPLRGELLLHGSWPESAAMAVRSAWQLLAQRGLGDRPLPGALEDWRLTAAPAAPPPPGAHGLRLDFATPCRLQEGTTSVDRLDASSIARAILVRWRALHRQLSGNEPCREELAKALVQHANNLRSVGEKPRRFRLDLPAPIPDMPLRLEAVGGTVTIVGPAFERWRPLLAEAAHLQIGRLTAHGLGSAALTWQDDHGNPL